MITQIIRLPEIKQNKLWLTNLWFDCILLILPSFLGLAFLLPYYILGPNSVVYIYFFQTFFLGGPHFFLSFYYIYYKKKDIRLAVVGFISLFSIIGIYFFFEYKNSSYSNIVFSIIFYLAAWHNYRQHYGISKLYDTVLAKRFNGSDVQSDMRPLYTLYFLILLAITHRGLNNTHFEINLIKDWTVSLIYPDIPDVLYKAYLFLIAVYSFFVIKKCVYIRFKKHKPMLLPQYFILFSSAFTYYILFYLVDKSALLLVWLIPTIAHNIQYFGFVWLFEKKYAEKFDLKELAGLARLAKKNSWLYFYSLTLVGSIFTLLLTYAPNASWYIIFVYFVSMFHYLVDGFIWKKKYNTSVVSVVDQLG